MKLTSVLATSGVNTSKAVKLLNKITEEDWNYTRRFLGEIYEQYKEAHNLYRNMTTKEQERAALLKYEQMYTRIGEAKKMHDKRLSEDLAANKVTSSAKSEPKKRIPIQLRPSANQSNPISEKLANQKTSSKKTPSQKVDVQPKKIRKEKDPVCFFCKDHKMLRMELKRNERYKKMLFGAPLYEIHYEKVINILDELSGKYKLRNLCEFGSGSLMFMKRFLKRSLTWRNVTCIDNQGFCNNLRAIPHRISMNDRKDEKSSELMISLVKGSIGELNNCYINADAVIALDLIHELAPSDLEAIPYNIFGIVQPKLVVISTFNLEFNCVRTTPIKVVRWERHLFLWNRTVFEDWANNIVERFPEYKVSFTGVGTLRDWPNVGPYEQIAIFELKDIPKPSARDPVIDKIDQTVGELENLAGSYGMCTHEMKGPYIPYEMVSRKVYNIISREKYVIEYFKSFLEVIVHKAMVHSLNGMKKLILPVDLIVRNYNFEHNGLSYEWLKITEDEAIKILRKNKFEVVYQNTYYQNSFFQSFNNGLFNCLIKNTLFSPKSTEKVDCYICNISVKQDLALSTRFADIFEEISRREVSRLPIERELNKVVTCLLIRSTDKENDRCDSDGEDHCHKNKCDAHKHQQELFKGIENIINLAQTKNQRKDGNFRKGAVLETKSGKSLDKDDFTAVLETDSEDSLDKYEIPAVLEIDSAKSFDAEKGLEECNYDQRQNGESYLQNNQEQKERKTKDYQIDELEQIEFCDSDISFKEECSDSRYSTCTEENSSWDDIANDFQADVCKSSNNLPNPDKPKKCKKKKTKIIVKQKDDNDSDWVLVDDDRLENEAKMKNRSIGKQLRASILKEKLSTKNFMNALHK